MRLVHSGDDLRRADAPILLVLRALKIGDLLVAVPALTALRRAFPRHQLVLAAPGWLRPLAALIPAVDALLPTPDVTAPLPLAAGVVDIAVNLHGNGPQSRAVIAALAPRATLTHRSPASPDGAPWLPEAHERERWTHLVMHYGHPADPSALSIRVPDTPPPVAAAAVVHVGAAHRSREWPAARFAAVARALTDDGLHVVITGGAADRERALRVAEGAELPASRVLAGRAELDAFAAMVAAARVVVTVDTGAAHLASAYGTPSVVLFGPVSPTAWGPPPGPHIVLTAAHLRRGDPFASAPDPALLAVTAQDAVTAVRRLLAQTAANWADRRGM